MDFDLLHLSRKQIPIPVVRAILKQSLEGLIYLH